MNIPKYMVVEMLKKIIWDIESQSGNDYPARSCDPFGVLGVEVTSSTSRYDFRLEFSLEDNDFSSSRKHKFLIGQRVILNGTEIGVVAKPDDSNFDPTRLVWVMPSSVGWASVYDLQNVRPLPNGQL